MLLKKLSTRCSVLVTTLAFFSPCRVPGLLLFECCSEYKSQPSFPTRLSSDLESMSTKAHFNSLTLHRRQGFLDLLHRLRRLISNHFYSYYQGLRPDKARIGRKLTHAIHEAANAVADGIFDVEGDKNTHSTK